MFQTFIISYIVFSEHLWSIALKVQIMAGCSACWHVATSACWSHLLESLNKKEITLTDYSAFVKEVIKKVNETRIKLWKTVIHESLALYDITEIHFHWFSTFQLRKEKLPLKHLHIQTAWLLFFSLGGVFHFKLEASWNSRRSLSMWVVWCRFMRGSDVLVIAHL